MWLDAYVRNSTGDLDVDLLRNLEGMLLVRETMRIAKVTLAQLKWADEMFCSCTEQNTGHIVPSASVKFASWSGVMLHRDSRVRGVPPGVENREVDRCAELN